MANAPFDYKQDQRLVSDGKDGTYEPKQAFIAHLEWSATEGALGTVTSVHAAVTDTGASQEVTTAITNPVCARNVTATAGGTAADIKAIQVIVEGTDMNGATITETLPVFTVNTAGTVVGSKAFKTVTKITIPAHDGTGATTSAGVGSKLGLPYKLENNTVLKAYHNNTLEATAPTVAVSTSALESNTATFNTALNGSVLDLYLMVD
jgi:hypothetical protein